MPQRHEIRALMGYSSPGFRVDERRPVCEPGGVKRAVDLTLTASFADLIRQSLRRFAVPRSAAVRSAAVRSAVTLAGLVVLGLWSVGTHANTETSQGAHRTARRITGITTIYPWEAEARAAAAPNGELPLAALTQTSSDQNKSPVAPIAPTAWGGERTTWAVAQQELAWRAALPSSGIGSWGVNPVSHPERALVEVLIGGGSAGVGVVLEGGAVLTSLATIGRGIELSIRFSDGAVEAASVRRTHRAYDLALLEPFGHKVRVGVPLARVVVEPLKLLQRRRAVRATTKATVPQVVDAATTVTVSWFGAVWGADGVPIAGAIRPPLLTELGSPLITSSGHLAALVTLGCVLPLEQAEKGPAGCRVTRVGLSSGALGEFLGMVEVDPTHVWFGVVGETTDTGWARGVRVKGVSPGSPAAYAGLRAHTDSVVGDVIVAVDNIPVHDLEQLKAILKTQHPGAQPQLTVLRDGRLTYVPVQLPMGQRALPGAATPLLRF
jgi:2-alkenal reductase